MTTQLIPSDVDSLVQLCCTEFDAAGASAAATDGPNSYVSGSAAGLYLALATIPFQSTDYGAGVTELIFPDTATDLNTVGVTNLPWQAEGLQGPSFAWEPIGGDPAVLISRFGGQARFTLSLLLAGVLAGGDECAVWITKNTTEIVPGQVVFTVNASGDVTANLVAVDRSCSVGDEYMVSAQNSGSPGGSLFANEEQSFWLAERIIAPSVTATLDVYDSNDNLVYTTDTDRVDGYVGTVRLNSLVMLTDHGRVKVSLTHNFGTSDLEAATETHLDLAYIAPPVPIEECGEGGGGGGGG